jgi:glyoxylase-like metal-dependent hydrolase (beta-lactamase superfamily II)
MDHFQFGEFTIFPLLDGPLPTTLDKIPDPGHRTEAQKLVDQIGPAALVMNVYAFLVCGPSGNVLIDAGAGKQRNDRLGQVPARLSSLGISCGEIDAVFMTHLHYDHFGGLWTPDGAVFPNAEIVIYREEAQFWLDTPLAGLPERARLGAGAVRECMGHYEGRIRVAEAGEQILGLRAVPAKGHSHGHCCWHLESGGRSLLAWGDLIHIAHIHLPAPHIAFEYDIYPAEAFASRKRILDWVTDAGVFVAGAHLPSPGIGSVVRRQEGYAFSSDGLA